MGRTTIIVIGVIITAVLTLTCLVMSIVFAYDISLVYPNSVVNVISIDQGISFYLRCDQANGGGLITILALCNITSFEIQPHCNILSLQSYYYQTYAAGLVKTCPTGYLQSATSTTNLGVNLVALASAMMMLGMFIVWIPIGIFALCSM